MKNKLILPLTLASAVMALSYSTFAGGKDYDVDRYRPPAEENASATVDKSSSKSAPAKIEKSTNGSGIKDEAVLADVFNEATAKLKLAESFYQQKKFTDALSVSKESLDYVRQQTGVHPKANYKNKFSISKDFFTTTNDSTISFENLPLKARDQVAMALQSEQNGYFLDLLNLAKRTNLIYIKAFVATLKQQGQLLARDVSKVKQDILDVYAIPLFVRNNDIDRLYAVFDFEVASSDQNYLFNRELYTFMLDNPEFFGADSEEAAEAILKQHIQQVRKKLNDDIAGYEPLGYPETLSDQQMLEIDDVKKCQATMSASYDVDFSQASQKQQEQEAFEIAKKIGIKKLDKFLSGQSNEVKQMFQVTYTIDSEIYNKNRRLNMYASGYYYDLNTPNKYHFEFEFSKRGTKIKEAALMSCIANNHKVRFSNKKFQSCMSQMETVLSERLVGYPMRTQILANKYCAEITAVKNQNEIEVPSNKDKFYEKFKDMIDHAKTYFVTNGFYAYEKFVFENIHYKIEYTAKATPVHFEIRKLTERYYLEWRNILQLEKGYRDARSYGYSDNIDRSRLGDANKAFYSTQDEIKKLVDTVTLTETDWLRISTNVENDGETDFYKWIEIK